MELDQYLVALVMVQTTGLRTIPLGLSLFIGRYQTDYARSRPRP